MKGVSECVDCMCILYENPVSININQSAVQKCQGFAHSGHIQKPTLELN